jgi:hypothetical protein
MKGYSRKEFEELQATMLFCPRCQRPMPVREKLLLVLPDGDLYHYLCVGCGQSLGSRTVRQKRPGIIGGA